MMRPTSINCRVSLMSSRDGDGSPGHGVALRNVRERLALLHDVQGQFRSGLKDGVYQVRMEVPL